MKPTPHTDIATDKIPYAPLDTFKPNSFLYHMRYSDYAVPIKRGIATFNFKQAKK